MLLPSEHSGVLPLPGHNNEPGPPTGPEHQLPNKEGAVEDVLYATAEEG